jgi:hypothetical protein
MPATSAILCLPPSRGQALNVPTSFGNKSLFLWVADDSWETGGTKAKLVNQSMVNNLIDAFLTAGTDNDIYDWVTAIYGEEWSSSGFSELIAPTDEIHIVLFDINDDNSTTGGPWAISGPRTISQPLQYRAPTKKFSLLWTRSWWPPPKALPGSPVIIGSRSVSAHWPTSFSI